MLTVHSEHPYRALPWVPKAEWREPSQAQPKDQLGNQNCTRFRLTARLNDGYVCWRGWFESREDADAFLWALARYVALGEPMPRSLWELPTPAWHPGIGPWITYDFATLSFLATPTGSNQTFTSPSDWNNSLNAIETIGAGASGANNYNTAAIHATGGGGGAWNGLGTSASLGANFTFATPGTTSATYQIGTGGAAVVRTTAGQTAGNNGGDSWFNGTTLAGSSVGSKGAVGGVVAAASQNGGAGGVGASGIGTASHDGGRGGNLTGANGAGGSGGGGAAGSTANGVAGTDSSSTSLTATAGGGADLGGSSPGAGGAGSTTAAGGVGTAGAEWDGTHGSGGGGGGCAINGAGAAAGSGGNYGGGGGANGEATSGTGTSGAGIQGLIVVTYTPVASVPFMPWYQMAPILAQ